MSLAKLFGLKRRRGFSRLDNRVAKTAGRKGGRKAHDVSKKKTERCHEWTSETARNAVMKRWAMRDARKNNAA